MQRQTLLNHFDIASIVISERQCGGSGVAITTLEL